MQELEAVVEELKAENEHQAGAADLSGANGADKLVASLRKKVAALEEAARARAREDAKPDLVRDLIRAAQPSAEESRVVKELQAKVSRFPRSPPLLIASVRAPPPQR